MLKHKKKEFINQQETTGKQINKYFNVSNEKQELINILMSFQPSNKKNAQKDSKSAKEPIEDCKVKREVCKEDLIKDLAQDIEPSKKVDNIEIVNVNERQKNNIQSKTDYKHEKSTIDNSSNLSTLARDKKKINQEFKTVDYEKKDNSRNLTAFGADENDKMHSLKQNAQNHINYIKNRRTGSTDCTNNNKLNKRDAKKIPKFQRKAVIELDTDEGEVIVSKRQNNVEKISPSPSPNKYDIEPIVQTKTAFNAVIKNNYMDKTVYRHDYKQTTKVTAY